MNQLMSRPHFQCVDCATVMTVVSSDTLTCSKCSKAYTRTHGVYQAYPTELDALSREEAEYHDHFDEDAGEVHQLGAWRNRFYHERLWQALRAVPAGQSLLEIGAGSGFDAGQLTTHSLTLTDISSQTLERLREKLVRKDPLYVACDGAKLPFVDNSFAGVYTVATWHHFADPAVALAEMRRVLIPGGTLAIAVEPNRVYFRIIKKTRHVLCKLTRTHEHEGSHADAEMEGFSYAQLTTLFSDKDWAEVQIKPMWFLAGFLHYFLEFLFRAAKLKKRLIFPLFLEKVIVGIDELIFQIPFVNRLGWHWSIVAKKK